MAYDTIFERIFLVYFCNQPTKTQKKRAFARFLSVALVDTTDAVINKSWRDKDEQFGFIHCFAIVFKQTPHPRNVSQKWHFMVGIF